MALFSRLVLPLLAVLGAIITEPPRVHGEPCRDPHCQLDQRLDIFKATGQKPSWTPLQAQFADTPGRSRAQPANHHNSTSSKLLPWVVPNKASVGHLPETWVTKRPRRESWGPEEITCTSTPPFKFYILEEAMLPNCPSFNSGEELVKLKGRNGGKLGGLHLGENFFYWQLVNHTWRTYDPMEAQLVVVPAFLNMLSYQEGFCGPIKDGLNHISRAVLKSPRYRVNEGRDFLMLSTGFAPQMLFARDTPTKRLFHKATRNFIYVSRLNGKFIRLRFVQQQTRCVIAAPYADQNAVSKCTGNDKDGLRCEDVKHEATFEEFMANREYNMFLMGQADNRIAYESRRLAVTQASVVHPPNFIIGTSSTRVLLPPHCQGIPTSWNGCFATGSDVPRHLYVDYLPRSKLSLMMAGDDPSSGKFYDALTHGTPNLVISSGWYDQAAPFRCRVPYKDMAYFLNEEDFRAATYTYTSRAMEKIYKNGAALLRKKWETQRRHAKDLLWHVPGSRVAHNVLEQAYRSCLTELRGNNDAS